MLQEDVSAEGAWGGEVIRTEAMVINSVIVISSVMVISSVVHDRKIL